MCGSTVGTSVQRDRESLVADAIAAERAGAFAVLIECVPSSIGKAITEAVRVPTIGIGAGRDVTGQVLVTHDLIGLTAGYTPKFVRTLADVGATIESAAGDFKTAVADGTFPSDSESFE